MRLFLCMILAMTNAAIANASIDLSQPLFRHGEIESTQPIQLPRIASAPNDPFSILFHFNADGSIGSRPKDDTLRPDTIVPACEFQVSYSYEDIDEMSRTGFFPALNLVNNFTLTQGAIHLSGTSGKMKVVGVSFSVSKPGPATLGLQLVYLDGRPSESFLNTVFCDGEDLRLSDLADSLPNSFRIKTWGN